MRLHPLLRLALVVLSLAPTLRADDLYVDAVNGDNLNSGTSAGDAWLTLTHAVGHLPPGLYHTIHVAPGTYNAGLGESFPIPVKSGLTLRAQSAGERPCIDADGAPALLELVGEPGTPFLQTHVEGLWLVDAVIGIDARLAADRSCDFKLIDVELSRMTQVAIAIDVHATVLDNIGCLIEMENSLIRRCGGAVTAYSSDEIDVQAAFGFRATSSVIQDNGFGLWGAGGNFRIADCLLQRNAGTVLGGALLGSDVESSVLVDNGQVYDGLTFSYGSFSECTVAFNAVGFEANTFNTGHCTLLDCIVSSNGDDIVGSDVTASYSNIGDGDFAGNNGNISADPLFWAPDFRELRLRAGSPCIDSGDPNGPLDPDGSVGDMGAFPFDATYAPEIRNYCQAGLNSLGSQAAISAQGSVSLTANDFTLSSMHCPPGKFGLYFYGDSRLELPFGDGFRCVGLGIFRLSPPLTIDVGGVATRPLDFSLPPLNSGPGAILPGSSWNFQFWYRDPAGSGGSGFNLSDGLTAWFLP